ncbi:hypothetical protein [Tenacibaculum sp. IB213877]|uniref:hypothetical protein n=1 Tax=Tenacibaculum sp. IB213877 TaxID=3097351 RepID=UPI002A59DF49|nr:hypothetical protein [Tenacibaculum sp. IB213877]MDY0780211.1 hypothetical protein [Tenacibaculum sp. IB213877]
MKAVFIHGKQYKKELLLSHKEVEKLQSFLQSSTHNDVLILNTNLGVEIYYSCSLDCSSIIVNSFLMFFSKTNKCKEDFKIVSINSNEDLVNRATYIFKKLVTMPMIFTSYSKSTYNQLTHLCVNNTKLVNQLLVLWQEVLFLEAQNEEPSLKSRKFLENIQNVYVDNYCKKPMQELIKIAMCKLRYN